MLTARRSQPIESHHGCFTYGACANKQPRAISARPVQPVGRIASKLASRNVAMKQLCVVTALLALALAEPTIYFKETFEDGE